MRPGLIAILLTVGAGLAHADGSGSAAPAPTDLKKIPEEEPVAKTPLIIAGVALAIFAVVLLLGRRRKNQPQALTGDLAEVRLLIETDERAIVWTQPSLKLPTDRQGEVLLHLPIGTHTVNVQIGDETFRRTIEVPAIRRMRLPINFTKERISRAASGEMAAVSPPPAKPQTTQVAGLSPRSQSTTKPPTSMARAYPDSSTQSELGDKLAKLIDVELDAPKPATPSALPLDTGLDPGAGAIDFSPQRAPSTTKPPPLALDFSTPTTPPGSLELDDAELEIPVVTPVAPQLPPQPARPSPLAGSGALPAPPARVSPLRDVLAPSNPQRSALGDAGPSRGRPPTSPLEGIRSEERPPKQPTLPPARAGFDLSLDDIAPVQHGAPAAPMVSAVDLVPPPRELAPPVRPPEKPGAARPSKADTAKAASAIMDFDLDLGPAAPAPAAVSLGPIPDLDLAPPERSTHRPAPAKPSVDVGDFALDNFSQPTPAPMVELPKVSAGSVMDLTLEDDDLPVQRIPSPRTQVAKPTPDIGDFEIEDTPPPQAPRPAADDRPAVRPATPARPTPSPTAARAPIGVPASIPAPRPAASGVGAIGNRYRKTGGAGAAPLGALYRGRDESAGRDVWIEELPRELALAVPAAALAKLEHANILKFYEHVVDATKSYIVTDVVEGKSLEQLLTERGGTLSALEAIGMVDQVCAALAYAHERGVFHRSVRPACIWISGRTVKVTGFGMSLGKPTVYQAPELSAGAQPDVRTDLYSVGITIAQMLTGSVPAPGKLDLPADVPRNLAGLIRKLVSHEPMIRPGNVKTVRDAFSSVF